MPVAQPHRGIQQAVGQSSLNVDKGADPEIQLVNCY